MSSPTRPPFSAKAEAVRQAIFDAEKEIEKFRAGQVLTQPVVQILPDAPLLLPSSDPAVRDVRVVLDANDAYWKGKPKVRSVAFRAIPEDAARFDRQWRAAMASATAETSFSASNFPEWMPTTWNGCPRKGSSTARSMAAIPPLVSQAPRPWRCSPSSDEGKKGGTVFGKITSPTTWSRSWSRSTSSA